MRVPDAGARLRPPIRRRSIIIGAVIVVVIVGIIAIQALSGFYTNFLWFHYSGVGVVWRTVTITKIELAVVFIAIAFVALFSCLFVVDKVAPRAMFMAPDSELVRRYQAIVGPRALLVRIIVSFLVALAIGASASDQWQHWVLFEHAISFHQVDPLFHRDLSYFVFRLPFLSFLVDWVLTMLLVTLIVTIVAYFLNGAIRLQASPRVEPRALAHLSLVLAAMALVRAWAYYYVDRFTLDLSHNGVVEGAGYTDVHVRLPAMTLLAVISLAGFVLLAVNIYQRTLVLPAIAVGLWLFLALTIGVIVPALVQAIKVTPAQSTLELPYISRNIVATQQASGIADVAAHQFQANEDLTAGVADLYASTLDEVPLWDPTYSAPTFERLQHIKSFYQLTNLTIDRYPISDSLTPVILGVRSLNSSGLASQSWVNVHLQYTHGYGVVAAPANTATQGGNPDFALGNLPPTSSVRSLALKNPSVYFAPGQSTYVVADTKQPEVDYPIGNGGSNVETHYSGSGGIPISSLLTRVAFSLRLHDFNLLVSSDITSKSRLIYIPDVNALVQKSLPFLHIDSSPYAVVANGQIDWVVDGYTTTAYYPYAQTVPTSELPAGNGLSGTYNYVRDAVKIVVNAYTGKMQMYTIDPKSDPLIESYEEAFPGLFQPLSKMPMVLQQHLRYPQAFLMVQAAAYGRYHIPASQPQNFYSLSDAWNLSLTSTSASGSPADPLATNANGETASFTPVYELLELPDQTTQSFDAVEPLVPYSPNDTLETLSALMTADSDAGSYGQLQAFVTQRGHSIDGPALANADINSNPTVSKAISLLDKGGSAVSLGTVLPIPIADSLLYVRPLYVSSSQTQLPQLAYVVVVYGTIVEMEPTLAGALDAALGASLPTSGGGSSTAIPTQVRGLVSQAVTQFDAASQALASGDLGTYQSDINTAGSLLNQANTILKATTKSSSIKATRTTNASRSTVNATNTAYLKTGA